MNKFIISRFGETIQVSQLINELESQYQVKICNTELSKINYSVLEKFAESNDVIISTINIEDVILLSDSLDVSRYVLTFNSFEDRINLLKKQLNNFQQLSFKDKDDFDRFYDLYSHNPFFISILKFTGEM